MNDGIVYVLDFWVWTLDLLLNHCLWLLRFMLDGVSLSSLMVMSWCGGGGKMSNFRLSFVLGLLMDCSNLFLHFFFFFGLCLFSAILNLDP